MQMRGLCVSEYTHFKLRPIYWREREAGLGSQSYIIRVHPHHSREGFYSDQFPKLHFAAARTPVLGKKGSARLYFLAPALFATLGAAAYAPDERDIEK
jgi:hypothetical protein